MNRRLLVSGMVLLIALVAIGCGESETTTETTIPDLPDVEGQDLPAPEQDGSALREASEGPDWPEPTVQEMPATQPSGSQLPAPEQAGSPLREETP